MIVASRAVVDALKLATLAALVSGIVRQQMSAVEKVKSLIENMDQLVFVYGTLKTNEPNHHVISEQGQGRQSAFVGKGQTFQRFPLVIASRYNIPYLLDSPGTGKQIRGEVYRVNDLQLEKLDQLEGVPDHYQRRKEKVQLLEGSKAEIECWLYIKSNFKAEILQLDHISEYSHLADKSKRYIPR